MQIFEYLASLKPATRELAALRWAVPPTTPRVTAELLRTSRTAHRLFRILADDGAAPLVRSMIEHAGGPLPVTQAAANQAIAVRDRLLLLESEEGWSMPSDLVLAMLKFAHHERFYAGTLLMRVSEEEIRQVAVELGLRSHGTQAALVSSLAQALRGMRDDSADTRRAAETTVELKALPAASIKDVHVVVGSAGCRFRILLEGREVIVAPREVADALGMTCAVPFVDATEPPHPSTAAPAREVQLNMPPHIPVGAVVIFSTPRAADEAMRVAEFRTLVLRRLGDRHVVTRDGVDAQQAQAVLNAHGFGEP